MPARSQKYSPALRRFFRLEENILLKRSFTNTRKAVAAASSFLQWVKSASTYRVAQKQGGATLPLFKKLLKRYVIFLLLLIPAWFLTGIIMIQLPLQRPPLLSLDMLSFLPLALTLELILVFLFATVVIMQSAYLLRKGPFYRYTLPDDADQVRLEGCKGGIISLAYGFPHYLYQDDDTLESHVRAAEVLNRARLYPRDRSGMQLTNDFAMYCDLMVEGFRLGYHSFLQECLDAPDQLESVRQQIQSLSLLGEMVQWTVGSMLHGRAQRYFQKYRTEEAPERATE